MGDEGAIDLGAKYREVLVKEIRTHRSYSLAAGITGLGLVGLGILITASTSVLGWLLVLLGILRLVSALYDMGRKDALQKSLERIDENAGTRLGSD